LSAHGLECDRNHRIQTVPFGHFGDNPVGHTRDVIANSGLKAPGEEPAVSLRITSMILSARPALDFFCEDSSFAFPRPESRGPQIHASPSAACGESAPAGLWSMVPDSSRVHGLRQSAACTDASILQRRGFKPSLARTLCGFFGRPGLRNKGW